MSVKHSTASDATFSVSGATAWDASHTVEVGTITEAMQVLADNTTADVSITKHGYAPKAPNDATKFLDGTGAYSVPAGAVALSGISAASASHTITSGNNTGQIWNWANTTDSTVAFTFGETSAATGGTSSSGIPNQVLLKINTLAASTQSVLSVYARGAHVFSVPPAGGQILAATGTGSAPMYSFASGTNYGMYKSGSSLQFSIAGGLGFYIDASQILIGGSGSATTPAVSDVGNATSGLFFGSHILGVGDSTDGEWARFLTRALQFSRGSADATAYAINARKSRGTVASPTVITTADDLLTVSGYGYLGATNTYREAARLTFTSAGTISDATNGIGSVATISGTTQGTDTTPQPTLVITGGSTATIKFAGSGMFTANGTVATAMSNLGPVGSHTTIQKWLTITDNGGVVGYVPVF